LQEEFGVGKIVAYLIGVLRAGNKTFAAQDTFVGNDMRLIFGEADCLDLAVPYALMAVLAVRLFEFVIVVHWFPRFR